MNKQSKYDTQSASKAQLDVWIPKWDEFAKTHHITPESQEWVQSMKKQQKRRNKSGRA